MSADVDDLGGRIAAPLVSVVTPFYNTAEYLEQCIRSVLGQTLVDFEYILVDNCSTDGGGEIARRFAAIDDRIRVISPPTFLSQCDNFNFALNQISPGSTYCKMVLADDWIYPQCLAEMVALADEHPSIGLVSSYTIFGTAVQGAGLPVDRSVYSGREIARLHLLEGTLRVRQQLHRDVPGGHRAGDVGVLHAREGLLRHGCRAARALRRTTSVSSTRC